MTTTDDVAPTAAPAEDSPILFSRAGATPDEQRRTNEIIAAREDEPPPDVPRDRYDQPIIVLPDGSGVAAYRRASKYGGLIEDEYGIAQWHKRTVVWGMSRAHHLVVRAQSVTSQTASTDIVTLQDIADRAEIIAGADAGAVTGTGLHKLSERQDAGEDLSWLDPTTAAALCAYRRLMSIFEVLATELFVVHDELGSAGTLDRAVRLLVDLAFPDGVVIPAGTILIIDIKTGKISSAQYWASGYSCQQLAYAEGRPYRPGVTILADPKKRSVQNVLDVVDQPGQYGRLTWDEIGVPGGPSTRWALILHVPAMEPTAAKWERVDLDVARADAEAARQAWERKRVPRGARFLALPAAAFDEAVAAAEAERPADSSAVFPGPDDDPAGPPVDTASSDLESKINPQLVATLLERIYRADRIDMITQIYDAWGGSPSWTDEHATACETMVTKLTEPEDITTCDGCNYDRHLCPSCGTGVPHGKDVCRPCELRLLIDNVDQVAELDLLWEAHKPVDQGGDGLWAVDEHSAAAQAAYERLAGPEAPADGSTADDPATEPAGDDPAEQRPETDQAPETDPAPANTDGPGYPTVIDGATLYCPECCAPDEDPLPWCDHPATEQCLGPCRTRAHDPADCPDRAAQGAIHAAGPPVEVHVSGPFDQTMALEALRTALREALDLETVEGLYDAHKPVEDGGDGLWDDECTRLAQAAFDLMADRSGAPA